MSLASTGSLRLFAGVITAALLGGTALADPCGMVPPIYTGPGTPIARIGDQNTYVFHRNGVETFVIHPGFKGKVDDFGMLIPFPAVPELRKVPDNLFPHLRAAIDPPEVVVTIRKFLPGRTRAARGEKTAAARPMDKLALKREQVRVVKEEAVGMYEVAVLEAGSAKALQKWMDDHGYKYPQGMDKACEDYVALRWCFVAVKTKVGRMRGVDPRPGMRNVKPDLLKGMSFDGYVQAMGFRFKSRRLIVPMRLSAFNEGDLKNIVYVLAETPLKIRSVPEEYVVRQIPGEELLKNVTQPRPLRIIGGTVKDLSPAQRRGLKRRRDPVPHNGSARDLFAGDLLAVKTGRLSHPHEEKEKMLLRIGEKLGLRGPDIDRLNEAALKTDREKIVRKAIADLKGMTLSVIDGNYPRELLANQNLTFAEYRMPARRNSPRYYDATTKRPAPRRQGIRVEGALSLDDLPNRPTQLQQAANEAPLRGFPGALAAALSLVLVGSVHFLRRRRA